MSSAKFRFIFPSFILQYKEIISKHHFIFNEMYNFGNFVSNFPWQHIATQQIAPKVVIFQLVFKSVEELELAGKLQKKTFHPLSLKGSGKEKRRLRSIEKYFYSCFVFRIATADKSFFYPFFYFFRVSPGSSGRDQEGNVRRSVRRRKCDQLGSLSVDARAGLHAQLCHDQQLFHPR
jgi:hypothetical protein